MDNNIKYRIENIYEVTYASNNCTQQFKVISKLDWNDIYKPIKKLISIIEEENKNKETEHSKILKLYLSKMFGHEDRYLVEGSPLHDSIKTNRLILPECQGSIHKVSWKKIK